MAKTRSDDLVKRARLAIEEVHGDRSVDYETTIERLEELGSDIDGMIDALRDDIRARDA